MNPASPLDFMDKRLFAIEREMVFLKKQTPYTLLMMRVFEIGLPVLLSLFSIFFVMRYSLTEKRSHEIKDLLIQRNLQRLKDEDSETIAT
jgi:Na+/melibiose symporter-like transporter